jgi:putative Mg2+ transporter-C (MgtC) family protein
MTITLTWSDVALRLALTIIAGAVIGFERGETGHAAGLRTTLLVALAACLAMLQANWLMNTGGKASDSFVVTDLMRLPLGILSGVGFIGAGAILRKDDLIVGVTTAATLWYVTVIGLCFGGGQIELGVVGSLLGVIVLPGLRRLEARMRQERVFNLYVKWKGDTTSEDKILAAISASRLKASKIAVKYDNVEQTQELRCSVTHRPLAAEDPVPRALRELAHLQGIVELEWQG